jgi:hypothetical protein
LSLFFLSIFQLLAQNETNNSTSKTQLGIIVSSEQYAKLEQIVKLLIHYRKLILDVSSKKCTLDSIEWLRRPRYYKNETKLLVKTFNLEFEYGFEFLSLDLNDDDSNLLYQSSDVEFAVSNLIAMINSKSSPLIYGKKVFICVYFYYIVNLFAFIVFYFFKTQSLLRALSYLVGYENHFFICSNMTSTESLSNSCKAMALGAYWITFVNIQNLSASLMSFLSNILTQINDRKENVTINGEKFYSSSVKSSQTFAYFSTVENLNHTNLSDSKIDSLKVTKIDHYFSMFSKDLFDKFRIFKFDYYNLKNFIDFNLLSNGLVTTDSVSNELMKLNYIHENLLNSKLKCKRFTTKLF